ncbi:hypothetical protein ACNPNP_00090 [Microbacterium sp. AGC85]
MTTQVSPFEAAKTFDTQQALEAVAGDQTTREVTTSLLLRYIQRVFSYSFELARDVLNVLVRLGRATRSSFTTVRLA